MGSVGQVSAEPGKFSRDLMKGRLCSSVLGDVFKRRHNSAESTVGLEQRFRIDRNPRQTAVRFVDSHNDLRAGLTCTHGHGGGECLARKGWGILMDRTPTHTQ